MSYIVSCRRCGEDMEIPAWERAEMLINGGWVEHEICPRDFPNPERPS